MARPRARRKIKNPSQKVTRRVNKKLRKVPIASNPIIAKHYDQTKTLRQNYANMGLSADLNGSKGGSVMSSSSSPSSSAHSSSKSTADVDPACLAVTTKGKIINKLDLSSGITDVIEVGVIERDEEGNVKNVMIESVNPLDEEFDEKLKQNVEGFYGGKKTEVVKELEKLASLECKKERWQSEFEVKWIEDLIKKYDTDYNKMSRDLKLNVYQQTPAQLRRKVEKYLQSKS
ncbi:ribosome biogenesis protein Nop16 [Paraphysoderma sedebokerense]|nr:ribosome biogenesis protein Nop16 [Paraphysoderma sedebokerense]